MSRKNPEDAGNRKEKPAKVKQQKEERIPTKHLETAQIDYGVYVMTSGERILWTVLAAALLFGVGYVFYKSLIVSAVFAVLGIFYPSIREKEIAQKRQRDLNTQFKDMLYSISSAVSAGESVEHSLSSALDDLRKQYVDPNTSIIRELELMVSRVSLGMTIEDVFADFGRRSHSEDVQIFANIFEVSKRMGGNLMQIIRQSTDMISEKIDTKNEMETALAGRKMEQKVMTVMPILLVLFMTYATGGFMDLVFTTMVGRIAATAALICIIAGYFWSKKITDIQV